MRMRIFKNMFGRMRRDPVGFLVSVLATLSVFFAAAALFVFFAFGVYFPSFFCGRITESTGFSVNPQDSFINIYTGECSFKNIVVDNPSEFGNANFAKVSDLNLKISIPDFIFRGVINIRSIDCNIERLSCIINIENEYNLKVFVDAMSRCTEVPSGGIQQVRVRIGSYDYKNITEGDSVQWSRKMSFDFARSGVDSRQLFKDFSEALDAAGASFISKAFIEGGENL